MTSTSHQEPALPLWARAVDAATIALLLLAACVAIEGGFVVAPAGIRLSIRSEWRVLLWAGALAALRHLAVPWLPLHRRVAARVGAAARAAGPLRDDLVLLGQAAPERPGERRPGGRSIVLQVVAVLLLYAGLTAFMTYPQVRHLDHAVQDVGDPLLSTWRLAWIARQLPRDPLHLFDGNVFYPAPRTLAFSDSMIVPALTAAPLVWLGVHQLHAYNILLLSGFAFSGAGMFLLVRSLTRHVGAALLAGFVFAFLPYRFMHYAHLELQMAQWMPLCLWSFHRTAERGRLRDGLLTGLFLALQTLSSWYYGIFFATYLALVATAVLIGAGRRRLAQSIRPLAAGALLAAILVAPFAVPYFAVRRSVGERPVSEIQFYSATPLNYLAAHSRNALFGPLTADWGAQERELFMGVAVPAIALVGLWPPLSAARIGYAVGLALAFDLSLGFNGLFYPLLHAYVLPYRGLRVPARMAIVVGLSLAILVGYGVARLCTRLRSRRASLAALAILFLLFLAEYRTALKLEWIWTRPPEIYDALGTQPTTVLAELPMVAPDIALEPIYMYFSTFRWHKLVNGYSGFSPPSYPQLVDLMRRFPDEAAIAELRRRDVEFVIVHGSFFRLGIYQKLMDGIRRSPDLEQVAHIRWNGGETRAYRLLPKPGVAEAR
ncbi:MAG: hypothetical protein ACRD1S_02060 [Vicinamibacterales bacterium]